MVGGENAHEKPHGHLCSALVPIILLGFFSHYYNYSANNGVATCYFDFTTGDF